MKTVCKILLIISIITAAFGCQMSCYAAGKDFTVVIDAGHGGKDTGAIDNNVKEKDINLGVALKLGELIKKKLKNTNVVFTRENDTYLTLQERADKANKSKGDLFISIHTNSVDKANKNRTTVCGASVYALGLHKDNNNMAVARRENSVIELEKNYEQKYSGFDPSKDESYILFEMAQKKNLSKSIKFANEVQKQLVATAGRRDRGVHQAGFWVLWATSMPAVLVELDFICNPNSAKFMGSEQGQQQLAQSIFNAVEKYSKTYQNSGKMTSAVEIEEDIEDALASNVVEKEGSGTTLASASSSVPRQHLTASVNKVSNRSSYATARRRRRSEAAKAVSLNRDLSTNKIEVKERKTADNSLAELADSKPSKNVAAASAKKDNNKKKSVKKETVKDEKKHHGKIEKLTNIYKIQILASTDKLKENNPRFMGLSPIKMFRENDLYKYTYGESQSKSEIETLLAEVKKLFPDAFLIKSITTRK